MMLSISLQQNTPTLGTANHWARVINLEPASDLQLPVWYSVLVMYKM